ncbi:EAL domain-containing response regulator [Achromobacter seleniivolatilans]|uniref:EAL domain-containing response regulator n=1 Tax=Achromobacter seleniivolatilans TaxID=3047478 RepID=A0ABY9M5V4_9BURK|nr:EAL domain-containing response regulator [Achromobacter sp. R39]WMD22092.1 EAL domain-containing response regulator [Achromobacter sp. R39]
MKLLTDYRILIVDDHPFQCAHLMNLLEGAGFAQADVAGSAEAALELISVQPYHLVVIDLNMPGMDGVLFIDRLATLADNPMLAIASACPLRIMNSVGLMAKEKGLAVVGTFAKPLTSDHARQLANHLRLQGSRAAKAAEQAEVETKFAKSTLVRALGDGQLRAWFQPKKALASGKIVAAEALVRWQHPEFGFMLPASFLSEIRRHALERALLVRMLEDSLSAHLRWRREGYRMPVAVNLPTQLLDDPGLPDELERIVTARGVPTQEISFELLEGETTRVQGQYYMGASRLRLKGFGLAQDDFGRGYSSMYSLISTPFTELKIDRAFVSGAADDEIRAAALVSSVQLGRQLGLQVTAEGVETTRDLEFLKRIGCDCAQGFLISAAVDAAAFSQLLFTERHVPDPYPQ